MGKGSGTTQTTQETNYGPWISDAQKAALGIAGAQNGSTVARGISPYSHAGFNMDQMKGFDLARDMVGKWGVGGTSGGTDALMNMLGSGQGMATASDAQAAQLSPTDYLPFMNQYVESNINPTVERLRRQEQEGLAQIQAQGASRAGFGGSGTALESGQLRRGTGETTANTVGSMLSNAYDNANQLASSNVDRQQQTNLQNANNQTQVSMGNANNALQGMSLLDAFNNSDFNRNRSVLQDLLGVGAFQQNDMQNYLNEPLDALARIFQYVPQMYDSTVTQTSPDNSPSFLQQLLGVALTGLPGGNINGTTSTANLLY